MREIRIFELDGRQTVDWTCDMPQSLQVLRGTLWVTMENHCADFWLRAGDSFDIVPGERVWLGTWTAPARFRISQPMPMMRPRRWGLPRLMRWPHWLGARLGWRTGRAQQ